MVKLVLLHHYILTRLMSGVNKVNYIFIHKLLTSIKCGLKMASSRVVL